ncbi:HepT-like ribonuclease domain-containing protein [Abyssalbus ytuae]|uniref:DUF86 domain-containing protein n=1 Tax=Abyssalbus ytuae TaxID=2926907 RepID=A0A9E6ZLF7_9FLAO|nr:HepT-like ribonuclease domain-containing protein [Abyssalbus ytuae]UOB16320.1 DUF86 domain-containing protein [Abyssalbus ytuae]
MSKRDILLLLDDMLDAGRKILKYTEGHDFDSFNSDDKTVDAVVRNFEIIGEAANRIDPDFRTLHPEIEWNRVRGFRNRIVHEYFGIDNRIVWSIIEGYLIELMNWIEKLIEDKKIT